MREEIDLIRKEKSIFDGLHKTFEKKIARIKDKINTNVNLASENYEKRQELRGELNKIKDQTLVEHNKIEYTMQDIKEKYSKQVRRNKGDWQAISGAFEPLPELANKAQKNQDGIKKDIDNYAQWKLSNDRFQALFARFCKAFKLTDISGITT